MALGKRKRERQEMWVATTDLPQSPGHPFYRKLDELLVDGGFDDFVEELCRPYYAEAHGRPSIPPGVYFRMILVGYFEGIGSQRGIAWRCSDSRSLSSFLGYGPTETTPDHSSLSRIHQRLPLAVHEEIFRFVLGLAVDRGLIGAKQVAVDSTTLEANAAMKSIVRKENGEDYKAYLRRLAKEAGIEDPTDEDLRRFDRDRKDKRVSNDEWESKTDPDSRIARMKDGRTHLAYKAEHVVDVDEGLLLAAEVTCADQGDAETLCDSVMTAAANLDAVGVETPIQEVAADKGYHKASTIELADGLAMRTYIPEPRSKHQRRWTDKPDGHRRAVHENRRRAKRAKSKRLQRRRSEICERSFAHVCETGGSRRCWLRGLEKVRKRYLLQAAAFNLGSILRAVFGIGTARSLQGLARLRATLAALVSLVRNVVKRLRTQSASVRRLVEETDNPQKTLPQVVVEAACSTGC